MYNGKHQPCVHKIHQRICFNNARGGDVVGFRLEGVTHGFGTMAKIEGNGSLMQTYWLQTQ